MSYIEFEKLEVVKGFKVVFPSLVTQEALLEWKQCLAQAVKAGGFADYRLLLDTNEHNFESVLCIKLLREILQDLSTGLLPMKVVAFVRPKVYGGTVIVSENEAYF